MTSVIELLVKQRDVDDIWVEIKNCKDIDGILSIFPHRAASSFATPRQGYRSLATTALREVEGRGRTAREPRRQGCLRGSLAVLPRPSTSLSAVVAKDRYPYRGVAMFKST